MIKTQINKLSTKSSSSASIAARAFLNSSKTQLLATRSSTSSSTTTSNSSSSEEEDEDATSICSSVSSLTIDDHDGHLQEQQQQQEGKVPAVVLPVPVPVPVPRRRGKFTITKAAKTPALTTGFTDTSVGTNDAKVTPNVDAVSISFLNSTTTSSSNKQPAVKQVIQRALTSLRPGGVFFVLDYKEESDTSNGDGTTTTTTPTSTTKSRAMKEIPDELVEQWNLTMVPTNLETFYNYKNKSRTSNTTAKPSSASASASASGPPPPAPRSSLAASKRIVRWMGVKPRQPTN